jgi:hypothetical protein
MTFDEFTARTLRQNQLPDPLDYGAAYRFVAADNGRFTFRLWAEGEKYRRRVLYVNDTALPESFGTARLIEGEYLNAPNSLHGHDGYLEVLHPLCDQPLVLDFRNRLVPRRGDNTAACPQWHLDVAGAYKQRSDQLWSAGRQVAATEALRERVAILERLTALDRKHMPTLVTVLNDYVAHRAGDPAGAVKAGERAVRLAEELARLRPVGSDQLVDYDRLVEHAPNEFWAGHYLQEALFYLSHAQWDTGNRPAAITTKRKRVRVFERLVDADPDQYQQDLLFATADLETYSAGAG